MMSIIREHGRRMGLCAVGIAAVEPMDPAALRVWLEAGYGAEMAFLTRHLPLRANLDAVLPGARSVICAAWCYADGASDASGIAQYARGRDYHDVMREALTALWDALRGYCPDERARIFVDSGPLPERELARRAGVGWVGAHSCLVVPGHGTRVVLGEILTTANFAPTTPLAPASCSACQRCRNACPTGAIVAAGMVDARRCLAYLTIEHRGPIPRELRAAMGTRLFGCDACQDACPWNVADHTCRRHTTLPQIAELTPIRALEMSQQEFRDHFCGTSLLRTRRSGLARNACVVLGNAGDSAALPALRQALRDEDALVRGHAAWALGQLGDRRSLETALSDEKDAWVIEELTIAVDPSPGR